MEIENKMEKVKQQTLKHEGKFVRLTLEFDSEKDAQEHMSDMIGW